MGDPYDPPPAPPAAGGPVIPDDQMFALPWDKKDSEVKQPEGEGFFDIPAEQKAGEKKEDGAMSADKAQETPEAEGKEDKETEKKEEKPTTPKEGGKKKTTKGKKKKADVKGEDAKPNRTKSLVLLGVGCAVAVVCLVLLIIVVLHGWADANFIPGLR